VEEIGIPVPIDIDLGPSLAVMWWSCGARACLQSSVYKSGGATMPKALKVFSRFLRDEDGAALIEYTVLLGILLIAVIATIGLVGTWVSKQWLALDKALSP
jgi:pilus assembly protein Flp/PilA